MECPNCGRSPIFLHVADYVVYKGVPEQHGCEAEAKIYHGDLIEDVFELRCPSCSWHTEQIELLDWEEADGFFLVRFNLPNEFRPDESRTDETRS